MRKNPKKLAEGCHKLAVLSGLMLETLDELKPLLGESIAFSNTCKDMEGKCEEIMKNVYGVDSIKSSTYLTELSTKVDTVIRKNYVHMTNNQSN